jgi:bifunctional aspartokinase / homoserine dehydrogenase 1
VSKTKSGAVEAAASNTRVVHKFGGSSVADAKCMTQVAKIVENDTRAQKIVVVSACKGVTDALLELVHKAERQSPEVATLLAQLKQRHLTLIAELFPSASASVQELVSELVADFSELAGILETVALVKTAAAALKDRVAGYGELWSSKIFVTLLRQRLNTDAIRWLDARTVLVVDWTALGPEVNWSVSQARLDASLAAQMPALMVIPGYVASTDEGIQTTLGRNGSDYSASIFAALLAAHEIVIWTDVDGVLSADPRRVAEARVIPKLSYPEAVELAYFGAKVIHPQTMAPAIDRAIPIWIKNTFNPSAHGSIIGAEPDVSQPVKGITNIENVALINLAGTGMIGVPGTAQRLFGALREAKVSVILISQGSSEHSICIAVPAPEVPVAVRSITAAFEREQRAGLIQQVEVIEPCAIIAVVGDGIAGQSGVAARVFKTLADSAINIKAIAQGSSERNISLVVDQALANRALNVVHSAFYLSAHTLSIGLIGPGWVGQALLNQIQSQAARLLSRSGIDLRVRAIASSQRMALFEQTAPTGSAKDYLQQHGEPVDFEAFTRHINAAHLPHALVIDCSASADVASRYEQWLAAGIHIVTPNKKANSGPLKAYQALIPARLRGGSQYYYEATVGAGLPIIQTLYDLRETGDEIVSIEGIFSGTLAYLFNVYDGKTPFSAIVREAKQKGYTEPDPRDDLSGTDVARKLTILAREIGLNLELQSIQLESLVPAELASGSIDDFLVGMSKFDDAMLARFERAQAQNKVLRYVGRLNGEGAATVGLLELEKSHPFAHIALTDNIIRFATRRYSQNPLIVQGPGAGPEVTAGGVFGDVLRLCVALGARL